MIIQVIQLTEHDLTCARFRRAGHDSLVPLSGFKLPYSDHSELSAILREQIPAQAAEEIRTILALPPSLVSLREMKLPITDRRKLRAILPLELAGETAQPDQELACDALPLANGSLLAGWASKDSVAQFITLLSEVNLEPEVVTLACMHWNLLIPQEPCEPVALLDQETLLVGQWGTHTPIFCRYLGQDQAGVTRTLSALELTKTITVQTIFSLEAELPFDLPPDCNLQPLPLPDLLTTPAAEGTMPAAMLAVPLATAQAYCNGTIFNLRNGSLAWTKQKSQFLRRHRFTLLLFAVVLLLLIAESGTRWFLLKRDLTSLNRPISKIYHEVFPTRKKAADETAEIKAEIRSLQGGIAPPSLLSFLTTLAATKGDQITGLSEVDSDGSRFRIKGDSLNSNDVNGFRQRLINAGWQVEQPETTTRPDGTVLFVLKGQKQGSAL